MTSYTCRVRRGFVQLLDMGTESCIEQLIANKTRPGLKRSERMKAKDVLDLRLCMAWIKEQAARESVVTPS